ncbi:MAG TPA: peptidoglycan-binding domain-containing protein [Bryobacteraceae bacterium]
MRWVCTLTLFATFLTTLAAAPPAKSSHKRTTTTTRRRVTRAKRRGPSYPTHPDAARYKEIQQALADKGYFKGEVNGQWGDDSVAAIKQFQADQKLPDDGKISAPVLIGLGLGPKHDAAPPPKPPAQ